MGRTRPRLTGDQQGIERLVRYRTRCPFSLSRLVKVTETGQVVYKAEKLGLPGLLRRSCATAARAGHGGQGATRCGWLGPRTGWLLFTQPDGFSRPAPGTHLRGHGHVLGYFLINTEARRHRDGVV
ncbi:MAG: transposase [Pirellulales bacterium]